MLDLSYRQAVTLAFSPGFAKTVASFQYPEEGPWQIMQYARNRAVVSLATYFGGVTITFVTYKPRTIPALGIAIEILGAAGMVASAIEFTQAVDAWNRYYVPPRRKSMTEKAITFKMGAEFVLDQVVINKIMLFYINVSQN